MTSITNDIQSNQWEKQKPQAYKEVLNDSF